MEVSKAENQQDISKVPKQLQPHCFKKGQSGNPEGRPKGVTLKEYCRKFLETQTPEEREAFLEGIPKESIWKMAEGNPANATDHTSKGDKIMFLPGELIDKNDISPDSKPSSEGHPQV